MLKRDWEGGYGRSWKDVIAFISCKWLSFFSNQNSIKYDIILTYYSPITIYTHMPMMITGHIMAWDFSDSSFRPSVVLKATHSKLLSMEFLTGNNLSVKHQLLAAGDETGTLHIFQMPRNLVRPAHKEVALMSTFLDREREVGD